MLSPLDPKRHFTMLYLNVYSDMSLSKRHFGSRGGGRGKASKNKPKDTSFIITLINVTILGVFHTHAQKEYSKVLEMKSTHNFNILALLLFFLN